MKQSLRLLVLLIILPLLSAGCASTDIDAVMLLPSISPSASLLALSANAPSGFAADLRYVQLPQRDQLSVSSIIGVADGFLAVGQAYQVAPGTSATVIRYDASGRELWTYQRSLSNGDSEYRCAVARGDGGVVALGRFVTKDYAEVGLVAAFSASGKLLWEQRLGWMADQNGGVHFERCTGDADGNVIALGCTSVYNVPMNEAYRPLLLVKYAADGQLLWQRELDFSGSLDVHCLATAPDGSSLVSLAIYPDKQGAKQYDLLLKFNASGQEVWRQVLKNDDYNFTVLEISFTADGQAFLSCKANYQGFIPEPPANPVQFSDRYRNWSYHPAAIIKLDSAGQLAWVQYEQGRFGASGSRIICVDDLVYAQITRVDDAVPPPPWMSTCVQAVTRETVVLLDVNGTKLGSAVLARDGLEGAQLIDVQTGILTVVGRSKSASPLDLLQTLPAEDVLRAESYIPPEGSGLSLEGARGLICKFLAETTKRGYEQLSITIGLQEVTTAAAWENGNLQLFRVKDDNFWLDGGIAVVSQRKVQGLLSGMPLFGVYLADLNHDQHYEVYGNSYFGSGIVSADINAIDTASGGTYHLSRRMVEDLYLSIAADGLGLQVSREPYGGGGKTSSSGQLLLTEDGLEIK